MPPGDQSVSGGLVKKAMVRVAASGAALVAMLLAGGAVKMSLMTNRQRGPASSTQLATRMFRNVQTATKVRLAAAVGLVATAGIVAAIAAVRRGFVLRSRSSSRSWSSVSSRSRRRTWRSWRGRTPVSAEASWCSWRRSSSSATTPTSWVRPSSAFSAASSISPISAIEHGRRSRSTARPRRWRCSAAPPRFSSPRRLARRAQPAILSLGVVCASAAYLGLNAVFVAFAVAVAQPRGVLPCPEGVLCLQRRRPSLCVPGARSRVGLPDARRRGGSPSGRADLDRPVDVRELLRAEGGSGADHRDADPRAGGEGPVHRRSRAARRHVLRVRRCRVRVRRNAAWSGSATPRSCTTSASSWCRTSCSTSPVG